MPKHPATLLIGPFIITDRPSPRTPARPAGGVMEATLASRGEYVLKGASQEFDGSEGQMKRYIDEKVKEMLPDQDRISGVRYLGAGADPQIAKAAREAHGEVTIVKEVKVAVSAKQVEQDARPIGTLDRSVVAADRSRSARQAEIAHARGRVGQEKANPGQIAASTWVVDPKLTVETDEDGSDYVVAGSMSTTRPAPNPAPTGPAVDRFVKTAVKDLVNPGTRLSTSKMAADRDRSRGVAAIRYSKEEIAAMSPFHRAAIQNAKQYACRNCKRTAYSDHGRTFCDECVRNGFGIPGAE